MHQESADRRKEDQLTVVPKDTEHAAYVSAQ